MASANENQLNLFAAQMPKAAPASMPAPRPAVDIASMTSDELLAAITQVGISDAEAVMQEAGRRELAAAVPALAEVIRRFTGFGADAPVREQVAALGALVAIGGAEAAGAVARIIERREVQGPTLATAVWAAAQLATTLPTTTVTDLLRHADPAIRADACHCARPSPVVINALIELLGDLNPGVHGAAACALGHMGRAEALPVLMRMLEKAPTVEVIEAIAGVLDDTAIVQLGRVARDRADLAHAVLEVLDGCELPLAAKVAGGVPTR
jgi:HEAT repeat protein